MTPPIIILASNKERFNVSYQVQYSYCTYDWLTIIMEKFKYFEFKIQTSSQENRIIHRQSLSRSDASRVSHNVNMNGS